MSLNPNNYKLSDKTGKLLATGKITDIFLKFLIRIMPSLIQYINFKIPPRPHYQ